MAYNLKEMAVWNPVSKNEQNRRFIIENATVSQDNHALVEVSLQ
jgi:hypothetical protein